IHSAHQELISTLEVQAESVSEPLDIQWLKKVKNAYPLTQKIPLNNAEVASSDFLNAKDLLDPVKKMIAAHDPKGLAGGFHYGFESEAIYREFWREAFDKGSSSGEIKDLAFSATG